MSDQAISAIVGATLLTCGAVGAGAFMRLRRGESTVAQERRASAWALIGVVVAGVLFIAVIGGAGRSDHYLFLPSAPTS